MKWKMTLGFKHRQLKWWLSKVLWIKLFETNRQFIVILAINSHRVGGYSGVLIATACISWGDTFSCLQVEPPAMPGAANTQGTVWQSFNFSHMKWATCIWLRSFAISNWAKEYESKLTQMGTFKVSSVHLFPISKQSHFVFIGGAKSSIRSHIPLRWGPSWQGHSRCFSRILCPIIQI